MKVFDIINIINCIITTFIASRNDGWQGTQNRLNKIFISNTEKL